MSNATTAVAIGLALLGSGLGVASYTKSQRLEQALAARNASESSSKEKDDSGGNRGLEDRVRTLERQVARLSYGGAAGGPVAAGAAARPGAAPGAPAAEEERPKDPRIAKLLEPQALAARLEKVKGTIKERWDKWAEQNGVPEKSRAEFVKMLEDAAAKREEVRLKRRNQDIDAETARLENRKVVDDVRARAKEMLSDEQFQKFIAERGHTAGTSWRDTRRALREASKPAAAPAEGAAPAAP
jgi:hypothetical protein